MTVTKLDSVRAGLCSSGHIRLTVFSCAPGRASAREGKGNAWVETLPRVLHETVFLVDAICNARCVRDGGGVPMND